MFNIHVDKVGDLAILECEGRIVRSEAAFSLRDAFTSQRDARIVVLDLSEVEAVEGGGLGMLVFLQRWAQDHDIKLKVFNPSNPVQHKLEHTCSMSAFEIATADDMLALLNQAESR